MDLQELRTNILEYFSGLEFDPGLHKYAVDRVPIKYSVSGLIKKYSNPFNADKMAPYSAKKEGLTVAQIKAKWRKAKRDSLIIGNAAHDFGEYYAFDRTLVPQDGYQQAIVNFWNCLPPELEIVFVELRMYHKTKMYAGTMDILLYNRNTGNFIIADYKTNKDLFKNYKEQKLTGKFSHLLDRPYEKYCIQLNHYQEQIEQITGIKVTQRKLIWVKPDGTFEIHDCPDMQDLIKIEAKPKTKRRWYSQPV